MLTSGIDKLASRTASAGTPGFGEAEWRAEISKTRNDPLAIGRDGLIISLEGNEK